MEDRMERTHIGQRADELRSQDIKRQRKIKKIKTTVIVAAIGAASILGYQAGEHLLGRKAVVDNFHEKTEGYSYDENSQSGYHIKYHGEYYDDIDKGLHDWVSAARSSGIPDEEIYISLIETGMAIDGIQEAMGGFDMSFADGWKVCGDKYHETKANEGKAK